MSDTRFYLAEEQAGRLARVYLSKDAGLEQLVPDSTYGLPSIPFTVDYPYTGDSRAAAGGGGLISTAPDYARFALMLANGGELDGVRVLSRKGVELMTTDHVGELLAEAGFGFGFGVGVVRSPGEFDDEIDSWPLSRFGSAARHIGRFNGIHLAARPLPSYDWFRFKPTNNWDIAGEVLEQLKGVRHHPLIALAFPDDVAEGVDRLYASRHRLHSALLQLPRTLSHLDAHRGNLFTRFRDETVETVLIDWGGVGTAAVGVEIHQLAASFRSLRDMDMDRVYEVSDVVFENFVSGLQDMGWKGDPRQVRLGFAASIALCNGLGELKSIMRGGLDDKARRRVCELWGDRPIEENMARRGELLRFIFRLADEADLLMDRLSLN